jgi:hypothetical protein
MQDTAGHSGPRKFLDRGHPARAASVEHGAVPHTTAGQSAGDVRQGIVRNRYQHTRAALGEILVRNYFDAANESRRFSGVRWRSAGYRRDRLAALAQQPSSACANPSRSNDSDRVHHHQLTTSKGWQADLTAGDRGDQVDRIEDIRVSRSYATATPSM